MITAWSDSFFRAMPPRPRLSLSEWADAHRVIPRGTSPEAGPWRTSRTPYLREPMNAISDPEVEMVVCQWGSQLGKTDGLLLNAIGYYASQDPSPMLIVQSREIDAKSFRTERVVPMFRATPALQTKVSDSIRDEKNTEILMQFGGGGYLAYAWATSSASLASRPIRILLADEIDRWPLFIGRDGDPWDQARQRTSNFHNRKIVAVSTPTVEGASKIAKLYQDTDQRRLWVPCLRCGAFQVLQWDRVIYKNTAGEHVLEDVHYRCIHCDGRIEERDRPEMLDACEWEADNPGHRHRGYQLSSLYSPWVKWRELAEEWITATRDRDRAKLQGFINLRLGETWTEQGNEVHAETLEARTEEYDAEVPPGALLLVCGVDVQDNRLEAEIVGWGIGKESWGIQYAIIPGDTSNTTPAGPWRRLDELLARAWSRADGTQLTLWCVCVDSGGHRTDEVYEFCRDRLARNIFPIKGRGGMGIVIAGKMTLNKLRAPLYEVGVDGAKDTLFSRLTLADPGPGYCHFPRNAGRGYDAEYFRGLVSEKRVTKVRLGRAVHVWTQKYARNEPLDCRNYATAAMELLNPNFEELAKVQSGPPQPPARPPRRKIYSKGVGW